MVEFQTSSYPPGYQFSPLSNPYGLGTNEMLDPQAFMFAGTNTLDLGGGPPSGGELDLSTPTALMPVLSYDLFRYTWNADGSGTFGGNTYMVTNGNRVYYIDISPLNAHRSVVVVSRQQPVQIQAPRQNKSGVTDHRN